MSHGMTVYGAVPNAMEMINSMGVAIAKSRLLGCENEDQGRVMAMACLAKGTDPMSLAQRYDIIPGQTEHEGRRHARDVPGDGR
jgi:hypothetical protein